MTCHTRHDLRKLSEPAAFLAALLEAAGSGHAGHDWQCPAHLDEAPSLGVRTARDGSALIHCAAGCTTSEVLSAVGLRLHHLYRPPEVDPVTWLRVTGLTPVFPPLRRPGHPSSTGYRLESVHDYGETFKLLRYRHPITERKAIQWERHNGGCWVPGLGGTPTTDLPLYREREVRMAVGAGELVVVVESESSVDAICQAGVYATTWAGGATSPNLHRLRQELGDHDQTLLVPDHDLVGLFCMATVHGALPRVRLLVPPEGQDARDLLNARGVRVFTEKENE